MSERGRRWRLLLGGGVADGTGTHLQERDAAIDRALAALYEPSAGGERRRGGLGASAPAVSRWLGDIRELFPSSVVHVMQRDALERLELKQMLLQPELLAAVEPDIQLAATLIALKDLVPAKAKAAARQVVARVVEEVRRRIERATAEAVTGSLSRAGTSYRPKPREIDWNRTIRANLRHWVPSHRTIIPERKIGFARRKAVLRELILCVDQSGSMARSVIYSGVFASVLASLPALAVRLVVFDTEVADLTEELHDDPVDLLFGVQLGGGTDIGRALSYCHELIERPEDTVLVLISDLFEGADPRRMLKRAQSIVASGARVIALLALDDEGAPAFDRDHAAAFAALGIPCFACTPDRFPGLIATVLAGRDVEEWAAREQIVLARPEGDG